MAVDVVIVGGWVMGASCAYWLTRLSPGLSVVLIEPDPTHARAATALSVASIRQQFTSAVNVQISRFGVGFIRDFAAQTGFSGDLGLREQGYLFLGTRAEAPAIMAEVAAMQHAEGAATEVLGRAEVARRWPWMRSDDISAASFGPRDEGWFDNMGLLRGFLEAARRQGVRVVHDRVTGFLNAGGSVTGVTLADGGRMDAGAFILAAGTATAGMLADLGVEIPVEPRKRTVFVVDAPAARHPDAPLVIDAAGVYFRPEGRAWIAATVPDVDGPCAPDDFEPDHAQFEELVWPRLWGRAPGFEAAKVLRAWVGHYDFNRFDQNALVGLVPGFCNLRLLNGFSGHGLQQSPALGRGTAEHVLAGRWQSLDLSDLEVSRLWSGRRVIERAVV